MANHKNFLVVDADADGRVLLARTLLRVFPDAAIVECQDAETAVNLVKAHNYDAVVAHRAIGADPEGLIRMIRERDRNVLLLSVSGIDRKKEVLNAGATDFLLYDEWLRVGTIIAEMLSSRSSAPFPVESVRTTLNLKPATG